MLLETFLLDMPAVNCGRSQRGANVASVPYPSCSIVALSGALHPRRDKQRSGDLDAASSTVLRTSFTWTPLNAAVCYTVTALEAAEVLQAVMESAAMVAPPCQLQMQIRGLPAPPEPAADSEALRDKLMGTSQTSLR